MTPPHIWESIIVHSATLFSPTGDKVRFSREEPARLQNSISGIFALALASAVLSANGKNAWERLERLC